MTRLFLAAGVAALAIASAASAKPGGGGGGGNPHGGGGGGGPPQMQQHGGGGGGGPPQMQQRGGGGGGNPHFEFARPGGGGGGGHGRGGRGFAPQQMQRFSMPRAERPRFERQQFRVERQARSRTFDRPQMRMERQVQNRGLERQQMRVQREARNHSFERQQMRGERQAQNRQFERQGIRAARMQQAQNRGFQRQQMREERMAQVRGFDRRKLREQQALQGRQFLTERLPQQQTFAVRNTDRQLRLNGDYSNRYYGAYNAAGGGCPPGLAAKHNGCLPPGQAMKLLGAPLSAVGGYAALNALPPAISYLYPDTPDYYWRYGDGYLYQVDRSDNVIADLLPLLAGGYLPGQYLPQPYMASYVPDYYGLNSFYPDYGDLCNRYANGVIYQVDCYSGMVEDVVPLYASGYGVGQILPTSYAYYNVPYQYRDLYYDTPSANYWYAPGAIYQYDPGSSMITSVAALLSPGFSVGQPLPMGYDVYNVPYDYRATYYDTPNAWYRYNNGYIYQVDPVTRLVTAIVASILT